MSFAHLKYRPDIDGLRACAVLSVIIFHAFPEVLGGGFVGVDVFFVISGYLITGIVARNIAVQRFSFGEFYERRIRRIFPALIVVIAFTIFVGWHTLLLNEFRQLGKHVAAAAVFVSNFVLYGESGYFDNVAETKPLLHLWSLSIEEQFYLVFPFMLLFLSKNGKKALKPVAFILAASFLINLWLSYTNPVAAFYFPFGRFWELMAGALLALYQLEGRNFSFGKRANHFLSISGFLLLSVSFFVVTKQMVFPGWVVLFPVVGAVLLIASGSNAVINKLLLSSRPMVLIGLISYPLYLWHWPLLSLPRIFIGNLPTHTKLGALVLTFLFSALTYKLVEKPFRYGGHGKFKSVLLVFFLIVLGGFGLNDFKRDGLPFRTFAKINALPSGYDGGAGPFVKELCGLKEAEAKKFRHCLTDSRDQPVYALYGDSKAGALYTGLFRTSREGGRWMFIGGNGPNGAPGSVLTDEELVHPSNAHSSLAIEAIAGNPNINIVLVATATRGLFPRNGYSFDYDHLTYQKSLHGLKNLVNRLVAANKKVVLLVDNPTFPEPQDCIRRTSDVELFNKLMPDRANAIKECDLTLSQHKEITGPYRKLLLDVQQTYPANVYLFDTTPFLCDESGDRCLTQYDDHALYDDGDHISDFASGVIGRALNEFLGTVR